MSDTDELYPDRHHEEPADLETEEGRERLHEIIGDGESAFRMPIITLGAFMHQCRASIDRADGSIWIGYITGPTHRAWTVAYNRDRTGHNVNPTTKRGRVKHQEVRVPGRAWHIWHGGTPWLTVTWDGRCWVHSRGRKAFGRVDLAGPFSDDMRAYIRVMGRMLPAPEKMPEEPGEETADTPKPPQEDTHAAEGNQSDLFG